MDDNIALKEVCSAVEETQMVTKLKNWDQAMLFFYLQLYNISYLSELYSDQSIEEKKSLGIVLYNLGRKKSAYKQLFFIYRLSSLPEQPDVFKLIAELLFRDKKFKMALYCYDKFIDILAKFKDTDDNSLQSAYAHRDLCEIMVNEKNSLVNNLVKPSLNNAHKWEEIQFNRRLKLIEHFLYYIPVENEIYYQFAFETIFNQNNFKQVESKLLSTIVLNNNDDLQNVLVGMFDFIKTIPAQDKFVRRILNSKQIPKILSLSLSMFPEIKYESFNKITFDDLILHFDEFIKTSKANNYLKYWKLYIISKLILSLQLHFSNDGSFELIKEIFEHLLNLCLTSYEFVKVDGELRKKNSKKMEVKRIKILKHVKEFIPDFRKFIVEAGLVCIYYVLVNSKHLQLNLKSNSGSNLNPNLSSRSSSISSSSSSLSSRSSTRSSSRSSSGSSSRSSSRSSETSNLNSSTNLLFASHFKQNVSRLMLFLSLARTENLKYSKKIFNIVNGYVHQTLAVLESRNVLSSLGNENTHLKKLNGFFLEKMMAFYLSAISNCALDDPCVIHLFDNVIYGLILHGGYHISTIWIVKFFRDLEAFKSSTSLISYEDNSDFFYNEFKNESCSSIEFQTLVDKIYHYRLLVEENGIEINEIYSKNDSRLLLPQVLIDDSNKLVYLSEFTNSMKEGSSLRLNISNLKDKQKGILRPTRQNIDECNRCSELFLDSFFNRFVIPIVRDSMKNKQVMRYVKKFYRGSLYFSIYEDSNKDGDKKKKINSTGLDNHSILNSFESGKDGLEELPLEDFIEFERVELN